MPDDMDLDMGTVLVVESIEQTGDLHEPRTTNAMGRKICGQENFRPVRLESGCVVESHGELALGQPFFYTIVQHYTRHRAQSLGAVS